MDEQYLAGYNDGRLLAEVALRSVWDDINKLRAQADSRALHPGTEKAHVRIYQVEAMSFRLAAEIIERKVKEL